MSAKILILEVYRKRGRTITPVVMQCGCLGVSELSSKDGIRYDPPIPFCADHSCEVTAEEFQNV